MQVQLFCFAGSKVVVVLQMFAFGTRYEHDILVQRYEHDMSCEKQKVADRVQQHARLVVWRSSSILSSTRWMCFNMELMERTETACAQDMMCPRRVDCLLVVTHSV